MTDSRWTEQRERSQARLTKAHLVKLGALGDEQHLQYTRSAAQGGNHSAWRNRRVAVVLAQGAARHFLRPRAGYGVKDLDVWTFYAARPSHSLRPGRYETHTDFGPSILGRNLYEPPVTGERRIWDAYLGRRVDFMVRELSVPAAADVEVVIGALRVWLISGAWQTCRHRSGGKNSSAHHLAHKAMVWVGTQQTRGQLGRVVWDDAKDFPGPPG